jgi:hypothetical protein
MAKAPPLSLFFDASHFAPPSKQTNDSERKTDGSRPAYGIGERGRHDLVAAALPMERERAKPLGVGWHGSSRWLLCVVCFVSILFVLIVE